MTTARGKRRGHRGPLPGSSVKGTPEKREINFDAIQVDDEELICPEGMDPDAFARLSRTGQRNAITSVSILEAGEVGSNDEDDEDDDDDEDEDDDEETLEENRRRSREYAA